MLHEPQIQPQQVTRPIQLLAAWLVGLIVIDGIFLQVAVQLDRGWERTGLVLAAILNVPLFLAAMFTLQTRFRAELQDDAHYARYLVKKTPESLTIRLVDDAGEAAAGEDGAIPVAGDVDELEVHGARDPHRDAETVGGS